MGRIDVHAHLLPAVDDGSKSIEESIAMARKMVAAGYTDQFCTPHIWPSLKNQVESIERDVAALQRAFDAARVPLRLRPGGELNLQPGMEKFLRDDVVTYDNAGKFAIFDFWAESLPANFWPFVQRLQAFDIQPILAHPERIAAVQRQPDLANTFRSGGLLLQCNLECLGEQAVTPRRTLAERWLQDGRYFMLGSDMHALDTLDRRLNGLLRAEALIGAEAVNGLTITNPAQLMA